MEHRCPKPPNPSAVPSLRNAGTPQLELIGSKQELLEATLDHHNRNHLTRVLAPIEAEDAGVDAIRTSFQDYASASEGWFNGRGCLMCNTAVERGALDPASGRDVAAYLNRLDRAFRNALANGRRSGDINQAADLDELAAFFTTALIGIAACIRAEAPSQQLQAASRVATRMLDAQVPATHT
jgi:AcrR family transcriptional regulator